MNSPYAKILRLALFTPVGILGAAFLILGTAGMFLYGILIAYRPSLVYQWQSWAYPLSFLLLSSIFLYVSIFNTRRSSFSFLQKIHNHEKKIRTEISEFDFENMEESSEFGVNSRDIEVLRIIKDSGGFLPVFIYIVHESPLSQEDAIRSLAKLSLLDYISLPKDTLKMTITPKGLDAMELPMITFASLVPWDISLMLIKANHLYREGNWEKAILEAYNLLERALKIHLIPTVEDYVEKWNELIKKRVGNDEKTFDIYRWRGEKTVASLNSLWNFYKKESNLGRKWSELVDRGVKYLEKEKSILKDRERLIDRGIDVIADTRSRYAHNKPGGKYEKDAYRIIKLTELIVGVLFEDIKRKVMS